MITEQKKLQVLQSPTRYTQLPSAQLIGVRVDEHLLIRYYPTRT